MVSIALESFLKEKSSSGFTTSSSERVSSATSQVLTAAGGPRSFSKVIKGSSKLTIYLTARGYVE